MQTGPVVDKGAGTDARMAADVDAVANDRAAAYVHEVADDRTVSDVRLTVDPASCPTREPEPMCTPGST